MLKVLLLIAALVAVNISGKPASFVSNFSNLFSCLLIIAGSQKYPAQAPPVPAGSGTVNLDNNLRLAWTISAPKVTFTLVLQRSAWVSLGISPQAGMSTLFAKYRTWGGRGVFNWHSRDDFGRHLHSRVSLQRSPKGL